MGESLGVIIEDQKLAPLNFNIEVQQLALPPNMALQLTLDPALLFLAQKVVPPQMQLSFGVRRN